VAHKNEFETDFNSQVPPSTSSASRPGPPTPDDDASVGCVAPPMPKPGEGGDEQSDKDSKETPVSAQESRVQELEESLDTLRGIVEEQNDTLIRYLSAPFIHGTVIHAGSEVKIKCYEYGDKCLVIDETSRNVGKVGRIVKKSQRRRETGVSDFPVDEKAEPVSDVIEKIERCGNEIDVAISVESANEKDIDNDLLTDGATSIESKPAETDGATSIESKPAETDGATSVEGQPIPANETTKAKAEKSEPVSEKGILYLEFSNGLQRPFQIGIGNEVPQVKLLSKNDGTNITIAVGTDHYEVWNLLELDLKLGDKVKANLQTKQIVERVDQVQPIGPTATVVRSINDATIELMLGGDKIIALQGPKIVEVDDKGETMERLPEEGDRVQLDRSLSIVVRNLPRDNEMRHKVDAASLTITFDDIAGVEDAKEALREAVEYPFTHKELYKFYNKQPPKGVLLHGPPGCGKTMLGKAVARLLATLHGAQAIESGFIYVKGPELLDKWVGSTETQIRELFVRGKKHHEKHGYPAILFIDEADAILRERGTQRSCDMDKTIVPMFLSEMDGLNPSSCIVILATNRPNTLDPAVVRDQRCDKHIKVSRPDQESSVDYFMLHLRGIPLEQAPGQSEIDAFAHAAASATAHLFSRNRTLYDLTDGMKNMKFCLSDAVSGAMIKGVVDEATTIAMKRNLANSPDQKPTGVTADDIIGAVESLYRQHLDISHNFDIEDFCDIHKMDVEKVKLSMKKCAGDY